MPRPRLLALLGAVLACVVAADDFCGVDPDAPLPTPDAADTCSSDNWNNFPSLANRTSFTSHYCQVLFLIDLSPEYISEYEFDKVLLPALTSMSDQCLKVGVGYIVMAFPLFNKTTETQKYCCAESGCGEILSPSNVDYHSWIYDYDDKSNQSSVWNETTSANFSYVLVREMKDVATSPCLYNTVVLFTNRIFNYQKGLLKDFPIIPNAGCITLTVVLLGRPDISNEEFARQYDNITTHLLQVNNVSCVYEITQCIPPCGFVPMQMCYDKANSSCPLPTAPPVTSPPPTTPTTMTPTPTSEFGAEWEHIVYMFALSNNTNDTEFQNALHYVKTPLAECLKKVSLVAQFLAENDTSSGWLHDIDAINNFMNNLKHDEIVIPAHRIDDLTEMFTLNMTERAYSVLVNEGQSKLGPRVILMTDFVSQKFIDAYTSSSPMQSMKWLQQHTTFEVYAFNENVVKEYANKTTIRTKYLFVDPDFNYESGPQDICEPGKGEKPPSPNTTVWFVIIGISFFLMVILLIFIVVYRQKLMWMQKLYLFKNKEDSSGHHSDDGGSEHYYTHNDDDDIIDYWEISWNHLIVNSEKLGTGAYGIVYKGKLLGASPGLEHYYPQESIAYHDCDVAVKLIQKHVGQKEMETFLREIDMMKTIGYNEHLVNMLGCSTQSAKRSCLVLEYCANKDLKRYVLKRKAELEQSRSIDEQIDCTKEFLHFAWQIASGMTFLVARGIVHRDLAARNIMIDELRNAKIGDFGLAFSTGDDAVDFVSNKLPIKWLAIECLEHHLFSHKSDVWAFGMVLWEMYSMGEAPFEDISYTEMLALLKEGKRPKRPLLATDKLDEVMHRCWAEFANDRPSFVELLTIFTILLEQATEGYGYLQLISDEYYKTLGPAADVPTIEVEEAEAEPDDASMKSGGMHILGNVTSVLRAAAQGIGRQFSSGKGAYPTQESTPKLFKRQKSGTVNTEASHQSEDSHHSRLQAEGPRPRRKSNDFLAWNTALNKINKLRRRSLDPDAVNTVKQAGKSDVPRLFSPRKTAKIRRRASQSSPRTTIVDETLSHSAVAEQRSVASSIS